MHRSGRLQDRHTSSVGDRVLLGRLERPQADSTTRIAVIGDPHVATRFTGTDRVFHRSEQRLRTVIDDVNRRDIDFVVFPGDLTKDGEPWNIDRIEKLLKELQIPFLATPGNHDLQKSGNDYTCPSSSILTERYAPGPYPIARDVGGVTLLVLNSAAGLSGPYTDTHQGRISEPQLAWLDDELETASIPIVVSHHNPIPLVEGALSHIDPWHIFTMANHDRIRSVLEAHDVPLTVCGHHHLPSLTKRNGIRQLIAPATSVYPQAYCVLEIDSTGTNVWLVSHADETRRSEAYELAAAGPPFVRTLLGLTEMTLADLPVLYGPPQIAQERTDN